MARLFQFRKNAFSVLRIPLVLVYSVIFICLFTARAQWLPDTEAGFADSSSGVPKCVIRTVFMPRWTVGFFTTRRDSTLHIDFVGNRFHVVGVDTAPQSTRVIRFQPRCDLASVQLVREPVGEMVFSLEAQPSVASFVDLASPDPVPFGFADELPKSLIQASRGPGHRLEILPC